MRKSAVAGAARAATRVPDSGTLPTMQQFTGEGDLLGTKAPEILKLEDGTEAERLDEIGGCGETDVIYLSPAWNFYHWHSKQRSFPRREIDVAG